jgi:hypothetical protein
MNIDGCFEMYGKHIRLCMEDFALVHRHYAELQMKVTRVRMYGKKLTSRASGRADRATVMIKHYESAYNYLFNGGLDEFINRFGIDLSADAIRKQAIEMAAEGQKYTEGLCNDKDMEVDI